MRSSDEYEAFAVKALEQANSAGTASDQIPKLQVEAQVWASLAVAASNLESKR
jgi:hypothetical protein